MLAQVCYLVNNYNYVVLGLSELGSPISLTLVGGFSYTDLIAFMRLTFTEDMCTRY
jgi:hypothetical protein